ncbi:LptF/LptG family permease [Breoghania sp. L-A4]|uniref:LptF/LptG family permease n=1 Tax=Breoghania sp. L-A4 TaxID=2304600 RepID=UPI0013C2B108|nr:LptF/LptG family permease [Breoghania sp. L-A4]
MQFLGITMLALPFLSLIIAPFAFIIALVIVFNALNSDNELIVIGATGAPRTKVLKPVLAAAGMLSILMLVCSLYVSPKGLAVLREELTKVRVDLLANIIRPGRFIEIDEGLTFHIRNRDGDGTLESLMLDDVRDPETSFTYLAESGQVAELADRMLLVMSNGTIQRRTGASGSISIVRFQSYAFDLTSLMPQTSAPVFKPSERTIAQLLWPDAGDDYYAANTERFAIELHDRIAQPLYPIAFGLIVFAFIGGARSTRQGRSAGVLAALLACVGMRVAGFGSTTLAVGNPSYMAGIYLVPVLTIALAGWLSVSNTRPRWLEALGERMERAVEAAQALLTRLGRRTPAGLA